MSFSYEDGSRLNNQIVGIHNCARD